MYTEMAQRLIGVRPTCQQAAALSRSSILLGAGRANLHLGRASKTPRPDTLVQTECVSQDIPLADGAGHTLPAAVPIARRPDCAGLPVTMLRHSDGKVRHDGSRAANKQRSYPVAERGRLHGASELNARALDRGVEHRMAYCRILEEELQCTISLEKYDRLIWQDKREHIALRLGLCFSTGDEAISQCAHVYCTLRGYRFLSYFCGLVQCAGVLPHLRRVGPGRGAWSETTR